MIDGHANKNPNIKVERPHSDVTDDTRQGNADPIKFQEVARQVKVHNPRPMDRD
jgi:hypothetical protein